MEMTKGYFKAKGHIWNLDNKEAYTNSAVRSLSFGIQTDKDNTIFVQVGEWKNTTMRVKVKGQGMTEVEEINEQDSIDKIKEFSFDADFCTFKVDPFGTIAIRVIEREPFKTIKLESEKSPMHFTIWIQLQEVAIDDTRLKLTFKADIPFMFKGMVSKPLEDGIKKVAEALANLPY